LYSGAIQTFRELMTGVFFKAFQARKEVVFFEILMIVFKVRCHVVEVGRFQVTRGEGKELSVGRSK